MPIDPQDGGLDDWFVPEADGYPNDWFVPEADGYPNDWFVPEADGYPNDWFVPASSAKPGGTSLATAPLADATKSNPFDGKASRSWISLNPYGRISSPDEGSPDLPWNFGTSGLLGRLANNSQNADDSQIQTRQDASQLPNWLNQYPAALPQSFKALPDIARTVFRPTSAQAAAAWLPPASGSYGIPWPSLPAISRPLTLGSAGDAFDTSAFQQTQPSDRPDFTNLLSLVTASPPSAAESVGNNTNRAPAANSSDEFAGPGSLTRVVRDSSGRPLAILHVEGERSGTSSSDVMSDASADALRPSDRYAQINDAVIGHPLIDRTTQFLLDALQQSIQAMGSGRGPLFGTKVHVDFARRVRGLDLPGIGKTGVEQTFRLGLSDLSDIVWYGIDGSIRTDVALRDPRRPDQAPIAVYDLKTGNAILTPKRAEEIRRHVDQENLPIILLHYVTGNAFLPKASNPP